MSLLTATPQLVSTVPFSRPFWPRLRSLLTNRVIWPQADYLVNQERKLIYCPIAKVACSSIKRWFLTLAGDPTPETEYVHGPVKRYALSRVNPSAAWRVLTDDSYFAFAFIRNPWSRLVSGYLNKFLRINNNSSTRVARRMGRSAPGKAGELLDITFAQFVRWLERCNPARFDVHWRPQHLYLQGRRFDFLGRLEHLQDDFDELQLRLGTSIPLPRCNTTRYASSLACPDKVADLTPQQLLGLGGLPHYRDFYTPELWDCVARIYSQDIRLGGYDFD